MHFDDENRLEFQPALPAAFLAVTGGDHDLAMWFPGAYLHESRAAEVMPYMTATGGDRELAVLAWKAGLSVDETVAQWHAGDLNPTTLQTIIESQGRWSTS